MAQVIRATEETTYMIDRLNRALDIAQYASFTLVALCGVVWATMVFHA